MKTFLNIKWLSIAIFILNLQSAIINTHSSNLYAQDLQLFEHTWYFVNGELNGEEFFPTENLTPELFFIDDFIDVGYTFCSGGATFEEINYNNDIFEILGDVFLLVDECFFPDHENELLLMQKHNLFYGDFQITGIPNNPFTYNIESVEDYLQLTIENGEGDWAVYNSVLLSTNLFHQNSFTIYPNPVKDNLSINNNTSNQSVTATIYDVSGKELQSYYVEANISSLNVKSLISGLYFIVFENEEGERVSKKFVKR